MTWQYAAKAVYAAVVALLGGVATILVDPEMGFGDIAAGQWMVIALATVVAFGGVLGLQAAPQTIATSVKE